MIKDGNINRRIVQWKFAFAGVVNMFIIQKEMTRPSAELLREFEALSTPLVVDSMGRFNAMRSCMRAVYPHARCCGSAVTVKCGPGDNLMIQAGLKYAQQGDVLVVDAEDARDFGHFGEIMALNAQRKGIRGLIIDGGVRDIADLEKMDFPVFATGVSPRGTGKTMGGYVNLPISCGGVSVSPGDIILADCCGVAVIPAGIAPEVLEKAQKKEAAEKEMFKRIADGEDLYDILDYEESLKKLIASLKIGDRLHHLPSELSGGQQQRVAIARALISKPAIILADEPTGNLDPKTGDQVLKHLKELASRFRQTILLVTHDMEIAAMADRVIRLHNGEIVETKNN